MRAMCSTASPTLFQLPTHMRAANPATPAANQKNVGVSRTSIANGLPRPTMRPAPTTPRSQRTITGTPPPVASIRTNPGASAVTLQAAHPVSAAAGEAGQPRRRRITAPGRMSVAHVEMASLTAVNGPPFGRSMASAQTTTPPTTISAKGSERGADSSDRSRGATTARPRARTSLNRSRRPFWTSGGKPHCGDTLVTRVAGPCRCRLALGGPLEVPPEQLEEACIRLRVALLKPCPDVGVDCRVRLLVVLGEVVQLPLAQPEEAERLGIGLLRAREQILRADHEQLLSIEMLEPAFELVGVQAAREVGPVAVLMMRPVAAREELLGLAHERLLDTGQALRLRGERFLEVELLAAGAGHHLVMRIGPLDGVAEERDQAHVGERLGHSRRDGWVEHVVRRRLARLEIVPALAVALARRGEGEERAVPVDALHELLVEEVRLLHPPDRGIAAARRGDVRMREQVAEERGRAGPLRSDDEEGGQDAPLAGRVAEAAARRPHGALHRRGQRNHPKD